MKTMVPTLVGPNLFNNKKFHSKQQQWKKKCLTIQSTMAKYIWIRLHRNLCSNHQKSWVFAAAHKQYTKTTIAIGIRLVGTFFSTQTIFRIAIFTFASMIIRFECWNVCCCNYVSYAKCTHIYNIFGVRVYIDYTTHRTINENTICRRA